MTTDFGGQEVQEIVIIYDKIISQNVRAIFLVAPIRDGIYSKNRFPFAVSLFSNRM